MSLFLLTQNAASHILPAEKAACLRTPLIEERNADASIMGAKMKTPGKSLRTPGPEGRPGISSKQQARRKRSPGGLLVGGQRGAALQKLRG